MNGGDLLLVGVVLVLGCAAFFVGVIYLFCSFVAFVGRGMLALVFPRRRMGRILSSLTRNGGVCPNPKCGEVDGRPARYCGHCGTRMKG